MLERIVISAPFGNYIQPRGATATLGTFTLLARPGRWWRTVRTVRYHRSLKSWTNQIGLRNPGIDWLRAKAESGSIDLRDKIVSVHGFDPGEWLAILPRADALAPAYVELNVSCPNVTDDVPDYAPIFAAAAALKSEVIVKLPPVAFEPIAAAALDVGLRAFHCCNTLPVPVGGISGQALKPLSLACVKTLLAAARSRGLAIEVIGGGGIKTAADIADYERVGATHFAVGSALLNPLFALSGISKLVREQGSLTSAASVVSQQV